MSSLAPGPDSPAWEPSTGSGTSAVSASAPENIANSLAPPSAEAPGLASKPKLSSCLVCRSRKVRCDKVSPCTNCRRAGIVCVFPQRAPKWARRLEQLTEDAAAGAAPAPAPKPEAGEVMERVLGLEKLVKELHAQLGRAHAAAASSAAGALAPNTVGTSSAGDAQAQLQERPVSTSSIDITGIERHFGRLVLRQDASHSRYVSSGFWSRISDEIDELKMSTTALAASDSELSEDETFPETSSSTPDVFRGQAPPEQHSFLFGHALGVPRPNLRDLHPLPSQIPFLVDVYTENVNVFVHFYHIPTIQNMVRELRGTGLSRLSPVHEAVMFSIYYAAVTSMEEDDVLVNFGSTKAELNRKYRLGLEQSLVKADFLNVPDIMLVQAFAVFLCLVRRHDSPRFVWMMTGLVVRMAQALGLHRDPSHFEHLGPLEAEMRRRTWWGLVMLDLRASEDQGTDFTIPFDSFDTRLPLNINDEDIGPDTQQMPASRRAITDMTFAITMSELLETTRRIMASTSLNDQLGLLESMYQSVEQNYIQFSTDPDGVVHQTGIMLTCITISKLRLIVYLPTLFSSPSEDLTGEIRNKLLISAIEVAEYNHALNADQERRHWRWVYQTYTHWHVIVYLLLEIGRRPWTPVIERAWIALHSSWLIPAKPDVGRNLQVWVPLQKLMSKARRHRQAELGRLRGDPRAVEELEMRDRDVPAPASPGPFPPDNGQEALRRHWRGLFAAAAEPRNRSPWPRSSRTSTSPFSNTDQGHSVPEPPGSAVPFPQHDTWPNEAAQPAFEPPITHSHNLASNLADQPLGAEFAPSWLWIDTDPMADVLSGTDMGMDMGEEVVNWYEWLKSAQDMEKGGGGAHAQGGS